MALLPKVKLKTLPTFPSTINGGTGIEVTKQNGAVTVDLDYSNFGSTSAIPVSPTNYILTYDTATDSYIMLPSHLLGAGVSGIADAPIDGTQYGRQSGAWTPVASTASDTPPLMNGAAAPGASPLYARGDHSHPTDITRAPLASPTFTGTVTTGPLNAGAVHAADIYAVRGASQGAVFFGSDGAHYISFDGTSFSLAGNIASPALVGVPTAPTAAPGTATTQLATTAFVQGAASNSFIQAGAGAVTRTMQDKARDIFSVKDFGAIGNGSADDTPAFIAAINAASAAGGGAVAAPNGRFRLTSALTLPDYVSLVGNGSSMTKLITDNPTLTFVNVSGFYNQVRGLSFDYTVTPTAGNVIYCAASSFSHIIEDILILNCWNGIVWVGTSNASSLQIGFLNFIRIYNFRSLGMQMQYVNDIFITNFLIFQKDIGFSAGTCGIQLLDKCEAVVLTNGDIVGGQNSLLMNAAANVNGQRPQSNAFTNVYFDTTTFGSTINVSAETSFTGCWFSAGGFGPATTSSLTINGGETNHFTNCRFVTAPLHGCVVQPGAKRTTFVNCSFTDNCVVAAAGTGHGLIIANTTDGVEVIGGSAKNINIPGHQGFGIAVGTGVNDLTIYGVDVRNNVSGGISIGTALSASVSVKDCKGFTSETRSVGTIPNGAPSAVVNHGLSGTPMTVVCTMLDTGGGPQAGGANIPRVLAIGPTSFTYDVGVLVNAARPFSWEAKL